MKFDFVYLGQTVLKYSVPLEIFVTLNDLYAFDPAVEVSIHEFEDIIGRHFRQPEEGLGYDNSPSAHMWRTIMRPTKFL